MLLVAAGETFDGISVQLRAVREQLVEEALEITNSDKISLKTCCRAAIRKHLSQISPVNLYYQISHLPITESQAEFLLCKIQPNSDYETQTECLNILNAGKFPTLKNYSQFHHFLVDGANIQPIPKIPCRTTPNRKEERKIEKRKQKLTAYHVSTSTEKKEKEKKKEKEEIPPETMKTLVDFKVPGLEFFRADNNDSDSDDFQSIDSSASSSDDDWIQFSQGMV